jgi:hypothetical protein
MKLIQITLIILIALVVFLYVNEGRIYHIARTLPFNSHGPMERDYELAGIVLLGLFLWGLYRRRRNGPDNDD